MSFLFLVMNKVGSVDPLENPLDTRKLESSSYHALGACLSPYNTFLRQSFVKLFVKLFVGTFWKAKQSDQLEWVLWYAPWLSDQLEWICGMLHGLVINWSSSAIETSRNRVNVFFIYHSNDLTGFKGELHENIGVHEILFCYAFSVSLLLTPLCCDDIHDVTPRVSALAGCDRLVSEPMVIEN
ncbi:hypothetical protein Tco_0822180 [Tanacetum coccineum]|uniref:Uncharacterized protein n=1 Tax=Tanacetum coccineum TaxID=301880 RepID=A0ABQ5AEB1_9ASTR